VGKYWLHDLYYPLKNNVDLLTRPGWETTSRSSGGFTDLLGVGTHHDASPVGTSRESRLNYAYNQASSRPIGNLWLHKNGQVTFGAAGASNTQGASEKVHITSKGTIPISRGNEYLISIEAENNGAGEVWPYVQTEAYLNLVGCICDHYGFNPLLDVFSHHRYTNRKIDPYGPADGRDWGPGKWDDLKFNQAVLDRKPNQVVKKDLMITIFKPTDCLAEFIAMTDSNGNALEVEWITTVADQRRRDAHIAAGAKVDRGPVTKGRFINCILNSALPVGDTYNWSPSDFHRIRY
jgi:N-acetylmuramoyl-L-alanine amidase